MPRPMSIYKVDYSAMTAAQIASHIETMQSIGKNPSGDARRALRSAQEREPFALSNCRIELTISRPFAPAVIARRPADS